jgi:putative ABC transport system permease protein
MRGLHALAWRSLLARPLRTALSIAGVALGVAVLFAGLATSAGVDAAIDRTVASLIGRADLRVAAFGETGLSTRSMDQIAGTPGVLVTAPALERQTYLGADAIGPDAVGPGDGLPPPVTVVGFDPATEGRLHDLSLASGSALADARHTDSSTAPALVSARLAHDDGLAIGSELTILGPFGPTPLHVAGILAADGPWAATDGRALLVPLPVAQAAFHDPGVTRVHLGLADGADATTVIDALATRLDTQPYVVTTPADLTGTMRAATSAFAATTALIAAVALFAGAFLIFNTLSMTVTERIRELGLLRAAGATRGQLTRFILVQASVIGLAGAALGTGLGVALGGAMAGWVGIVGPVPLGAPVATPGTVVSAVLVGWIVTLAAAIEPARRAARISPVEALKARLDPPTARRAHLRWLVAVFVAVAAVGLFLSPRGANDGALVRALAVYAVLLVAALVVPLVLPAIARLAGAPFLALVRLEERLARASVARDRSRAALTVGALTIGLAMVVALGGVGQHARAAAGSWIAEVVPGDLVVTSIRPVAADEGVVEILGSLPGVDSVSPIATFDLAVAGARVDGAVMDGGDLAADGRLRFLEGDREAAFDALEAGGAVLVPHSIAARDDLDVGGTLTVAGADGSAARLRIAGIVERTLPGRSGESLLVGWDDAPRLGAAGADAFAVRFDPSATAAERATLADEARALALEPVPLERINGAIGEALERVFGLFDALALVAVVVAALGIVNTLTMNVLERVREIGVLRAAGMTRRQVWRSVVVEAGITGLAGAILGVVTGLVVGALMVVFAGSDLDTAFGVPWATVALAVVLGVALAMLAAAYPARLASRLSIVRAVAFE